MTDRWNELNGMAAGVAGATAMGLVGLAGYGDWRPANYIGSTVPGARTTSRRFEPDTSVLGLGLHLATGAALGLGYALFAAPRYNLPWLDMAARGAAYGVAAFGLAGRLAGPAANPLVLRFPSGPYLGAHLVFGTTTALAHQALRSLTSRQPAPRPLDEQVVVLVGASSGIGRETALEFARRGARLVLAARDKRALEAVVEEVEWQGGTAIAVPMDVAHPEQVERLADEAIRRFGRIDTWINDAAVSLYATFEDAPVDEMRHQFDVMYWGVVHGLKAAIPRMREQGGTIITVGSVLSDVAVPYQSTYVAAKHALVGLLDSLRMELARADVPIALVLVKPTSTDTPFFTEAKTRLGVEPKPLAPVYDPAVVARAVARMAIAPRPNLTVGVGAVLSGLHRLAPRFVDRWMTRTGFSDQRTDEPKGPEDHTNFDAPTAGPRGSRGKHPGWKVSGVTWLEEHPGMALAAGAAIATLVTRRKT